MPRSPYTPIPASDVIPPTRAIDSAAKETVLAFLRTRQRPALAGAIKHGTRFNSASYVHQICRALAVEGRVQVFKKVASGQLRFYKLAEQDEAGSLFASDAPAPADEEQPEEVADDSVAPEANALGEIADALRSLEDLPDASSADLQAYGFRLEELDQLKDAVVDLARRASVRLAELRADRALELTSDDEDGTLPDAVERLVSIHHSVAELRSYLGSF